MKPAILSSHNEIDDTLKRYVENKICTALSVMLSRIKSIVVKLNSLKGSAGAARGCDIEIALDNNQTLVIHSQTSHWLAAIDEAVASAARALRRELKNQLLPTSKVASLSLAG
ncbi:MAG: HPF/RaiA family ribosome-associated protein [Limnobacter sp.]|nr:HPF/RaiA family ribosome-associated protein [Limnobacter sp.]